MKRREFIALLGGAAAAWPVAARAQQPPKPTVGYLGPNTRSLDGQRLVAFLERLRDFGWIEGRTIDIEYRWAEGRNDRLAEFAAEFVRRKVNVIVTSATPPTVAAKQATSVIPIVFASVGDPVGAGVVESLARPGGNATGLSLQATDAAGKRLELLRDVVPGLRRLAIMANSGNPSAALEMREAEATARALGLETIRSEILRAEDIAPAFDALKGRVEALYVCNDPLAGTNRVRISILAVGVRLPTMFIAGVRRSGRTDVVWSELPGPLSAHRRTCRQDSAWGETGRNPSRTADQIRSCREPDHFEGTRPYRAANPARPRRRGDRIVQPMFELALSGPIDMSAVLSAFGGEADIRGSRCLLWSDANDPSATSTGLKFRSVAVACAISFVPKRGEGTEQ
jgi:putative ABC transport system substrate-binding protein